ncbi:MAG: M20/M25/M40 family metallo-hydrolase [Myxococcales bacterium]|nr:M20/M25/M40 family metallo-hydrolase [Myxococcales bacterium]
MYRSVWLATLLLGTAAIAAPSKDPYAALRPSVAKIVGGSFDEAPLAQLAELTENIGGRVTGSKAYGQAVTWAMAQLTAAGAQHVHVEKFTLAHGWQRGPARGKVLSPRVRALHVESFGWAPSTPAGGVRGPVLLMHGFDDVPAQVKGAIVVVERPSGGGGPGPKRVLAMRKALTALHAGGARAVLVSMPASVTSNVLTTGSPFVDGQLAPLPAGVIGLEDERSIARAIDAGPVTVELEITNTVTGPIEVANVIGELPGKTRPNEWVLVGAHLDSWDFATGAQDNGAGVVQVLAAARLLAAAGPLERTVRFALWGGEEQWMIGSRAYVSAHEGELGGCIAALNTDNGAGHVVGWKVAGRKDVEAALSPIARRLLAPLGGAKLDLELTADTDHFAFLAAGVPALDLLVEDGNYEAAHHKQADTLDKLDSHALSSGISVVAVTVLALASTVEPFARRLDRAGVEQLLKPDGLDEMMRQNGWWK